MAGLLYGLDKELRAKQAAKYDAGLERQVEEWIQAISGEQRPEGESIAAWLKDGQVLCKLVNTIKPGIVKKVNTSKLAFKQMENITFFTHAARELGVPESATFSTPDLYEEKNVLSVLNCIYLLGGAVQVSCPEFEGPHLGVAMAVESKDRKRSNRIADQSQGFAATQEVQRPTERILGNVVKASGAAGAPKAAAVPCKPSGGSWIPKPTPSRGADEDLTQVAKSPAQPPPAAPPAPAEQDDEDDEDSSDEDESEEDEQAAALEAEGPAEPAEAVGSAPLQGDDRSGVDFFPAGAPERPDEDTLLGLDRMLHFKQEGKYDVALERQVVEWIELLTGQEKGEQTLGEWLRNGIVLCRLVNAVKPGTIKRVNAGSMAFKQMENITFFTNAIRDLGVPESAMFTSVDLYEERNLGALVNCIYTFGGVAQTVCPEYVESGAPTLGAPVAVDGKDRRR